MEHSEKNGNISKPKWVELVESLPEIVRQQVGTTCAGTISTLVQIGLMHSKLLDQVILEAEKVLSSYLNNNEDV